MNMESQASLARAQEVSHEIDKSIQANQYTRADRLTTVYCGILLTVLVNELLPEQPTTQILNHTGGLVN